jgi:hypothetical protein
LAADTADITLSSLARGKKDMLDAFLTTDASKGDVLFRIYVFTALTCFSLALMRVMVGDVIRDDGDDEDEEKMKKKLRTKKGSKKEKQTKKGSKEEKQTKKGSKEEKQTNVASVKKKAPRKRVKSTKFVIKDNDDEVPENTGGPSRDPNAALNEDASQSDFLNENGSEMYQSDFSMRVPSDSGES